ncbi:MAG: S8/S53 family peptidase [Candidatus Poseidoniaceae archaeon]
MQSDGAASGGVATPGVLLVATLLIAAGFCAMAMLNPSPSSVSEVDVDSNQEQDWRPFSVVAPIDTGINVYHNHFISDEVLPDWLLDAFGVTLVCSITTEGTYDERLAADQEACWSQIGSTDIVYFEGTRIIGTSPDWTEGDGTPILDDPSDGHGTAVTGAVVNANPDVVIFFVEGFSDAAVLAAAAQPLVDIISTSFGAPGSLPVPGIDDATRVAVVDHGKIHTGAADNSPSPAIQDATAGPPWSIGIAGYAEGEDEQKETMSGSYPDIAADWTQNLPNHQDLDGYHDTSGTSFATPKTAGILSGVLETLRSTVGDLGAGAENGRNGSLVLGALDDAPYSITNADVRDALNRSAWYPSSSTWDPLSGTNPISPVAPCTQVGWGVVNMSNLEPIIAHLDGTSLLPDRPADVVTCMDTNQQIREAYWGDGSEDEAALVPMQRAAERRW